MVSSEMALSEGLFSLDTGMVYCNEPSKPVSLDIALQKGLAQICSDEETQTSIDSKMSTPVNAQDLAQLSGDVFVQQCALDTILLQGKYNINTGTYTDQHGNGVPIETAVRDNILDEKNLKIRDPNSDSNISLSQAIEWGVYNKNTGCVVNTSSNESISLSHAIKLALIAPVALPAVGISMLVDKVKGNKTQSTAIAGDSAGVDVITYDKEPKMTPDEPGDQLQLQDAKNKTEDSGYPNIYDHHPLNVKETLILGMWDQQSCSVKDPRSGQYITLLEAITCKLIDNESTFALPGTDRYITLEDAIECGLLDPVTCNITDPSSGKKNNLLELLQPSNVHVQFSSKTSDSTSNLMQSINEAIDAGQYDMTTGLVTDNASNEQVSLGEAIKRNVVDPARSNVMHPVSQKSITLTEAIESQLVDLKRGVITNPTNNLEHPISSAIVMPEKYENIITPLSMFDILDRDLFVEESGRIRDPVTGCKVTLSQAMESGLINPESIQIRDAECGTLVSYSDAVNKGVIDSETGDVVDGDGEVLTFKEAVTSGLAVVAVKFNDINLLEAVQQGLYNPETGKITSTREGVEITLKQALQQGILNCTKTRIVDPHSDTQLTVEEAHESGLIDLESGTIEDPYTGKSLTIGEAIVQDLLIINDGKEDVTHRQSDDDQQQFEKNDTPTIAQPADMELSEAVQRGFVNPQTGMITHPDSGKQLTLSEAIDSRLVCIYSTLEDPATGKLATLQHMLEEGKIHSDRVQLTNIAEDKSYSISESLKKIIVPNIADENDSSPKESLSENETFAELKIDQDDILAYEDSTVTHKSHHDQVDEGESASPSMVIIDKLIPGVNYDIESGDVLSDNQSMPITAAVGDDKVDIQSILVRDPNSDSNISLQRAIADGIYDANSGNIVNQATSESISLVDAIKFAFFMPAIGVSMFANKTFNATQSATGSIETLLDDESNKFGIQSRPSTNIISPHSQSSEDLSSIVDDINSPKRQLGRLQRAASISTMEDVHLYSRVCTPDSVPESGPPVDKGIYKKWQSLESVEFSGMMAAFPNPAELFGARQNIGEKHHSNIKRELPGFFKQLKLNVTKTFNIKSTKGSSQSSSLGPSLTEDRENSSSESLHDQFSGEIKNDTVQSMVDKIKITSDNTETTPSEQIISLDENGVMNKTLAAKSSTEFEISKLNIADESQDVAIKETSQQTDVDYQVPIRQQGFQITEKRHLHDILNVTYDEPDNINASDNDGASDTAEAPGQVEQPNIALREDPVAFFQVGLNDKPIDISKVTNDEIYASKTPSLDDDNEECLASVSNDTSTQLVDGMTEDIGVSKSIIHGDIPAKFMFDSSVDVGITKPIGKFLPGKNEEINEIKYVTSTNNDPEVIKTHRVDIVHNTEINVTSETYMDSEEQCVVSSNALEDQHTLCTDDTGTDSNIANEQTADLSILTGEINEHAVTPTKQNIDSSETLLLEENTLFNVSLAPKGPRVLLSASSIPESISEPFGDTTSLPEQLSDITVITETNKCFQDSLVTKQQTVAFKSISDQIETNIEYKDPTTFDELMSENDIDLPAKTDHHASPLHFIDNLPCNTSDVCLSTQSVVDDTDRMIASTIKPSTQPESIVLMDVEIDPVTLSSSDRPEHSSPNADNSQVIIADLDPLPYVTNQGEPDSIQSVCTEIDKQVENDSYGKDVSVATKLVTFNRDNILVFNESNITANLSASEYHSSNKMFEEVKTTNVIDQTLPHSVSILPGNSTAAVHQLNATEEKGNVDIKVVDLCPSRPSASSDKSIETSSNKQTADTLPMETGITLDDDSIATLASRDQPTPKESGSLLEGISKADYVPGLSDTPGVNAVTGINRIIDITSSSMDGDGTSIHEPSIDKSSIDEPSIDEPSIDEPSIDEPSIDEPPIDRPSIDEPTIDERSIDDPSIDKPSIDKSSVDESSIGEPSMNSENILSDRSIEIVPCIPIDDQPVSMATVQKHIYGGQTKSGSEILKRYSPKVVVASISSAIDERQLCSDNKLDTDTDSQAPQHSISMLSETSVEILSTVPTAKQSHLIDDGTTDPCVSADVDSTKLVNYNVSQEEMPVTACLSQIPENENINDNKSDTNVMAEHENNCFMATGVTQNQSDADDKNNTELMDRVPQHSINTLSDKSVVLVPTLAITDQPPIITDCVSQSSGSEDLESNSGLDISQDEMTKTCPDLDKPEETIGEIVDATTSMDNEKTVNYGSTYTPAHSVDLELKKPILRITQNYPVNVSTVVGSATPELHASTDDAMNHDSDNLRDDVSCTTLDSQVSHPGNITDSISDGIKIDEPGVINDTTSVENRGVIDSVVDGPNLMQTVNIQSEIPVVSTSLVLDAHQTTDNDLTPKSNITKDGETNNDCDILQDTITVTHDLDATMESKSNKNNFADSHETDGQRTYDKRNGADAVSNEENPMNTVNILVGEVESISDGIKIDEPGVISDTTSVEDRGVSDSVVDEPNLMQSVNIQSDILVVSTSPVLDTHQTTNNDLKPKSNITKDRETNNYCDILQDTITVTHDLDATMESKSNKNNFADSHETDGQRTYDKRNGADAVSNEENPMNTVNILVGEVESISYGIKIDEPGVISDTTSVEDQGVIALVVDESNLMQSVNIQSEIPVVSTSPVLNTHETTDNGLTPESNITKDGETNNDCDILQDTIPVTHDFDVTMESKSSKNNFADSHENDGQNTYDKGNAAEAVSNEENPMNTVNILVSSGVKIDEPGVISDMITSDESRGVINSVVDEPNPMQSVNIQSEIAVVSTSPVLDAHQTTENGVKSESNVFKVRETNNDCDISQETICVAHDFDATMKSKSNANNFADSHETDGQRPNDKENTADVVSSEENSMNTVDILVGETIDAVSHLPIIDEHSFPSICGDAILPSPAVHRNQNQNDRAERLVGALVTEYIGPSASESEKIDNQRYNESELDYISGEQKPLPVVNKLSDTLIEAMSSVPILDDHQTTANTTDDGITIEPGLSKHLDAYNASDTLPDVKPETDLLSHTYNCDATTVLETCANNIAESNLKDDQISGSNENVVSIVVTEGSCTHEANILDNKSIGVISNPPVLNEGLARTEDNATPSYSSTSKHQEKCMALEKDNGRQVTSSKEMIKDPNRVGEHGKLEDEGSYKSGTDTVSGEQTRVDLINILPSASIAVIPTLPTTDQYPPEVNTIDTGVTTVFKELDSNTSSDSLDELPPQLYSFDQATSGGKPSKSTISEDTPENYKDTVDLASSEQKTIHSIDMLYKKPTEISSIMPIIDQCIPISDHVNDNDGQRDPSTFKNTNNDSDNKQAGISATKQSPQIPQSDGNIESESSTSTFIVTDVVDKTDPQLNSQISPDSIVTVVHQSVEVITSVQSIDQHPVTCDDTTAVERTNYQDKLLDNHSIAHEPVLDQIDIKIKQQIAEIPRQQPDQLYDMLIQQPLEFASNMPSVSHKVNKDVLTDVQAQNKDSSETESHGSSKELPNVLEPSPSGNVDSAILLGNTLDTKRITYEPQIPQALSGDECHKLFDTQSLDKIPAGKQISDNTVLSMQTQMIPSLHTVSVVPQTADNDSTPISVVDSHPDEIEVESNKVTAESSQEYIHEIPKKRMTSIVDKHTKTDDAEIQNPQCSSKTSNDEIIDSCSSPTIRNSSALTGNDNSIEIANTCSNLPHFNVVSTMPVGSALSDHRQIGTPSNVDSVASFQEKVNGNLESGHEINSVNTAEPNSEISNPILLSDEITNLDADDEGSSQADASLSDAVEPFTSEEYEKSITKYSGLEPCAADVQSVALDVIPKLKSEYSVVPGIELSDPNKLKSSETTNSSIHSPSENITSTSPAELSEETPTTTTGESVKVTAAVPA